VTIAYNFPLIVYCGGLPWFRVTRSQIRQTSVPPYQDVVPAVSPFTRPQHFSAVIHSHDVVEIPGQAGKRSDGPMSPEECTPDPFHACTAAPAAPLGGKRITYNLTPSIHSADDTLTGARQHSQRY